ncbi:MAG: ADP-ribose [Bacteroidetes bacterium]|nr:MAG: ADP-ribose [Bacteroidota bacterium]
MYKVFINDKPVFLCGKPDDGFSDGFQGAKIEVNGRKSIKAALKLFTENESGQEQFLIYNNRDVKKLLDDFISLFWYLEAAGGVVKNQEGNRLFIFRFGRWDLPKGKLEKGETPAEAALREVEEETGISGHRLISELPSTFHIYEHKGKKVLKRTYWYAMQYEGNEILAPQIEEEITNAEWINPERYTRIFNSTYASLHDLLKADISQRG